MIKRLTWVLFLLVFFLSSCFVCAQSKTITGIVYDGEEKYKPLKKVLINLTKPTKLEGLIGVSIGVKDAKPMRGTSTDVDGHYKIEVSPGDVLVFSYLGYKSVEKTVGDNDVLDVTLIAEEPVCTEPGISFATHYFFTGATYSKNHWGYYLGYEYAPDSYYQNTFQKILNEIHWGLRITDLNPQDAAVKLYPYLNIDLQKLGYLFVYEPYRVYPFIDGGYSMDTDFKRIVNTDFSYGGGIKCRLFWGASYRLSAAIGYAAFTRQSDNYFYVALRINPD